MGEARETIRRIWRWLILGSAIPPPPPVPRSDMHRLTHDTIEAE